MCLQENLTTDYVHVQSLNVIYRVRLYSVAPKSYITQVTTLFDSIPTNDKKRKENFFNVILNSNWVSTIKENYALRPNIFTPKKT